MKKSEVFPSKRLKKEDILGPTVATIASVVSEQMQEDSDEHKPVMYFNGHLKPMVLNSGNWDTIEMAYGEESNFWTGKAVEIYVDPTVCFKGKRVGGLKIRIPSGMSQNGHAQPSYGPSLMNWQMAVTALKGAGIPEDMLKQVLRSKGYAGYRADRDTQTVLSMIEEAKPKPESQEESFGDTQSEEIPFSFWIGLVGAGLSVATSMMV